jgi:hypothetical protein
MIKTLRELEDPVQPECGSWGSLNSLSNYHSDIVESLHLKLGLAGFSNSWLVLPLLSEALLVVKLGIFLGETLEVLVVRSLSIWG